MSEQPQPELPPTRECCYEGCEKRILPLYSACSEHRPLTHECAAKDCLVGLPLTQTYCEYHDEKCRLCLGPRATHTTAHAFREEITAEEEEPLGCKNCGAPVGDITGDCANLNCTGQLSEVPPPTEDTPLTPADLAILQSVHADGETILRSDVGRLLGALNTSAIVQAHQAQSMADMQVMVDEAVDETRKKTVELEAAVEIIEEQPHGLPTGVCSFCGAARDAVGGMVESRVACICPACALNAVGQLVDIAKQMLIQKASQERLQRMVTMQPGKPGEPAGEPDGA